MMAEEGTNVLTGAAQAAARGELHGDIHANTAARDAAMGVVPESGVEPAADMSVVPVSTPAEAEVAPEPDPEPPAHDSPIVD